MCELPEKSAVPPNWIFDFDSIEGRYTRVRFYDPEDHEACRVAEFCLLKRNVNQIQELMGKLPNQLTFSLIYEAAQRVWDSHECSRRKLTDPNW